MLSMLFLFVFLSYRDRNQVRSEDILSQAHLDTEKRSARASLSTVCAQVSRSQEGFIYKVSDGTELVRSDVSSSGILLSCTITANQSQVEAFVRQCGVDALESQRDAPERLDTRFARMSEAKSVCSEYQQSSRREKHEDAEDSTNPQEPVLKRSKRGFTYPGTLWCGAGNMADDYDQLGHFAETDSCCRTHDHCPHVIHAFSSKYGHTNFKWHSICHCDCDKALRACLRKVNDTSSRVVGQAFFNVIGVPCFEFIYEEQCAERQWYGLCKRYEKFPIAVLKNAVAYEYGGIDVIDELTLAPPRKEGSKENTEEEEDQEKKQQRATQFTVSTTEEPSLTNVVTAAEDFIKVLATVSTSQSSSSTDLDGGEKPSSEKKRRKNNGKKKKTKNQKGTKKKHKAVSNGITPNTATVSPAGSKPGEVIALSNVISESQQPSQLGKNTNRVSAHENQFQVVRSKTAVKDNNSLVKENTHSSAANTTIIPPKGMRMGRRKKNQKVPVASMNTIDDLGSSSAPTIITITTAKKQSPGADAEKGPVVSSVTEPSTVKRNKSKEQRLRQRRKKWRMVNLNSSVVTGGLQRSSVEIPKASSLAVSITAPELSHRKKKKSKTKTLNIIRGDSMDKKTRGQKDVGLQKSEFLNCPSSFTRHSKDQGAREKREKQKEDSGVSFTVATGCNDSSVDTDQTVPLTVLPTALPTQPQVLNLTFGSSKKQKSEERGLRRRATSLSLLGMKPRRKNNSVNVSSVFTISETTAAPVFTKQQNEDNRRQREPEQKDTTTPHMSAVSVPELKEDTHTTFTNTHSKATVAEELRPPPPSSTSPAPLIVSPIQLSIEKVKAHFNRKKRRKAALLSGWS